MSQDPKAVYYERLSGTDYSFLRLETGPTHMHVGACTYFTAAPLRKKGGILDEERIVRAIQSKLPMVPRFRQKLAWIPFEGRPVWVDDPNFNLRYHVRFTALPKPGNDQQFKTLLARVMSQALDRSKPLWEMWFVDGLKGDRLAILHKAHHCMVDGVGGIDLASVLMETSAEPLPIPEPEPWTARPQPGRTILIADYLRRRVSRPVTAFRALRQAVRRPVQTFERARQIVGAVSDILTPGLRLPPRTPFNAAIGPHRRIDWLEVRLADMKTIKNALGGTVNDAVLCVVSDALRRFLAHRGEKIAGIRLKAMVPVSVRQEDQHGTMGNRIASMIVELPVGESNHAKRIEAIQSATGSLKESKNALGAKVISRLADWAAPNLMAQAARLQIQRLPFNLVVTNVPGPQFPLYFQGAELQAVYPIVPLATGLALGIALVSYNGKLFYGLTGDWDIMSDLSVFADHIRQATAELLRIAEKRRPAAAG